MILKIKTPENGYRYFENIQTFDITPYHSDVYYVEYKTRKTFVKTDSGPVEILPSHVFVRDALVKSKDPIRSSTINVSCIMFDFVGCKEVCVCEAGCIFLMNDDGKTIDKY